MSCPCAKFSTCRYGESSGTSCPEYQDSVRPKWYEKIIGCIAIVLMGRW